MDPGKRYKTALSDINVTPLVDVMLVLLIIFMVTAPLMQQGIDVNLPKAKGKELRAEEERIIVIITKGNKIYINKNFIELSELGKKLQSIYDRRTDKEIFLKADKDVPYGFVVRAMSEIRSAGIEKLGMVTEPIENK
ncbi:MAG: protein TolR [Nitrospirae bacterium]|nr:protein TolR [Nitrospirota bacterium]